MEMTNFDQIRKFYSGKRVFVTGHTGFKGSWLTTWLHHLGAVVKGYALAPEKEKGSVYHDINAGRFCESVIGNIVDASHFRDALLSFQPDIIFHLAAQPLVSESYLHPVETIQTNVMGTVNLMESMRHLDGKCTAVIITTDKVYENQEWCFPYRETDTLGGHDPYSSSKACCELMINSYRNSFFNPSTYKEHGISLASARAGNVIGGGDWAENRIIPDVVRSILKMEPAMLRNPAAVRPWQHVLESLYGYLLLGLHMDAEPQTFQSSWNFGPNFNEIETVESIVKRFLEIWGSGTWSVANVENKVHETALLRLDSSKSSVKLGWFPRWNIEDSLEKTAKFYKGVYVDGEDGHALMIRQIEEYMS